MRLELAFGLEHSCGGPAKAHLAVFASVLTLRLVLRDDPDHRFAGVG